MIALSFTKLSDLACIGGRLFTYRRVPNNSYIFSLSYSDRVALVLFVSSFNLFYQHIIHYSRDYVIFTFHTFIAELAIWVYAIIISLS